MSRELLELTDHPILYKTTPSSRVSDKYLTITTAERLAEVKNLGWQQFRVGIVDSEDWGTQKHYVLLKHSSLSSVHGIDASLLAINSYDGSCKFRFLGAIYRRASKTWMVSGEVRSQDAFNHVAVRHWTYIDPLKNEQVEKTLNLLPDLSEHTRKMVETELSLIEQEAYAKAALELRYPREKGNAKVKIEPEVLLASRRKADNSPDLLTTLSKVQENLIEGDLPGIDTLGRKVSSRPLRDIKRIITLKQGLWVLATEMMRIKGL